VGLRVDYFAQIESHSGQSSLRRMFFAAPERRTLDNAILSERDPTMWLH
jgi:hypothetical protein